MAMQVKAVIMDEIKLSRTITRMAHEIIENNSDLSNLIIVGIKTRGVPLAKRLVSEITHFQNIEICFGECDITLYRDDLSELSNVPKINSTKIQCDLTNKTVILVDDVIFTGRTARAGIDAILAIGRPKKIQFTVLIDRGHRELPIRADYVGKNIPTSKEECVSVLLKEIDGEESVKLLSLK